MRRGCVVQVFEERVCRAGENHGVLSPRAGPVPLQVEVPLAAPALVELRSYFISNSAHRRVGKNR
ncbi:MAG TPA: hypothetical protein VG225_06925 [Terracidiphilus sp.]|nr:hypothetical protein [Terracidiphilus sp.]